MRSLVTMIFRSGAVLPKPFHRRWFIRNKTPSTSATTHPTYICHQSNTRGTSLSFRTIACGSNSPTSPTALRQIHQRASKGWSPTHIGLGSCASINDKTICSVDVRAERQVWQREMESGAVPRVVFETLVCSTDDGFVEEIQIQSGGEPEEPHICGGGMGSPSW